jgi:hypothetical protein
MKGGFMHRRVVLSAIAVGVLSVSSRAAPAEATAKFKVVKIPNTSVSTPPTITTTPACDPAGNCVFGYTVTAQLSGDLQGTLTNDGTIYTKAGSSTFQVTILGMFTGSVRGCGSGSFALYFPLTTGSSAPFTGHDMMVPGSATGDLTGSSQVGAWTYTFDPATNTSTASGFIRCRVG